MKKRLFRIGILIDASSDEIQSDIDGLTNLVDFINIATPYGVEIQEDEGAGLYYIDEGEWFPVNSQDALDRVKANNFEMRWFNEAPEGVEPMWADLD